MSINWGNLAVWILLTLGIIFAALSPLDWQRFAFAVIVAGCGLYLGTQVEVSRDE